MGPGSAASWLAPYAGQPPRGTARRSLTNGKRWFNGTRQRAIRRARRVCTSLRGRMRRAALSPVAQPPGYDLHEAAGGALGRARCGASGDAGQRGELSFPHMRDSRRVALCGVSHRRKVESWATRQRGELSSPICGTAAARICRDGAYRLLEDGFRGTKQRAIRRRRLHRRSHLHPLRPPTMWSERRYPLIIERSGSGSLQRPSRLAA